MCNSSAWPQINNGVSTCSGINTSSLKCLKNLIPTAWFHIMKIYQSLIVGKCVQQKPWSPPNPSNYLLGCQSLLSQIGPFPCVWGEVGRDWQRSCSLASSAPPQRALIPSEVKRQPVYHPVGADSHSAQPEASLWTITELFLIEQRLVIREGCSQLSGQEPHLAPFAQIQSPYSLSIKHLALTLYFYDAYNKCLRLF